MAWQLNDSSFDQCVGDTRQRTEAVFDENAAAAQLENGTKGRRRYSSDSSEFRSIQENPGRGTLPEIHLAIKSFAILSF